MEREENTHTNKHMNKQNKNKQLMHAAATDQPTELNFLFTNPWLSKMNKDQLQLVYAGNNMCRTAPIL